MWATAPIGGPDDQPAFLNVVIRVDPGTLGPTELLSAVNRVEASLGRVRDERWGPRTIDIDVLLWGDLVSHDPRLTIPHPRLHERAFVVLPLLDLEPDPVLPDGRRLLDLPAPRGDAEPVAPPLGAAMTAKVCLRCDWSGVTTDDSCPRCGAGLFASARTTPGDGAAHRTPH